MTLPSSHNVSGHLTRTGDSPAAFGGYADVWEGNYDGRKVCVKVMRISAKDDRTPEKVRIRYKYVFVVSAKQLWAS